MGTVFVGRRRRGRAIRAAAVLALLVVAMDVGRDALARARAFVVGWAARPLAERLAGGGGSLAALDEPIARRRDLARASLHATADPQGSAPVLAFDPARRSLVVALALDDSAESLAGAPVTDGRSLLGFVQRADFGLVRCRLLGDRGLTVAAEVTGPGTPVRFALVAGGSRGLRIRFATELAGVPAGAPVVTSAVPDAAAGGFPIGRTVASNGGPVADAVALAADPALAGRVTIARAGAGDPPADALVAYDRIAARVVAEEDASPYRRSILVVADAPLPPGALVDAHGVLVGRVASASEREVARVLRPEDPRFEVEAFVIPTSGGRPLARVRLGGAAREGEARLLAVSGPEDAAAAGALLVTAPDDGLAPPGIAIGVLAPTARLAPGAAVSVAFDGARLAPRGAAVAAHRLRSPLAAEEEGAP
jgi:hypothetical protein